MQTSLKYLEGFALFAAIVLTVKFAVISQKGVDPIEYTFTFAEYLRLTVPIILASMTFRFLRADSHQQSDEP